MSAIVDHVFPPTDAHSSPSMALDYSSFTFWREPLPRIIDEVKEVKEEETAAAAAPTVDNAKEMEKSGDNTPPSSSSSSPATVVENSDPWELIIDYNFLLRISSSTNVIGY